MIFDLNWWYSLSPHQLDVVRTIANVVGVALVPLLGLMLGWGIKLLRHIKREATHAKENTESMVMIEGKRYVVPIIDHIEAAAQETRDGFAWVKGAGRYRQETQDVTRITMSNYTAGEPHE